MKKHGIVCYIMVSRQKHCVWKTEASQCRPCRIIKSYKSETDPTFKATLNKMRKNRRATNGDDIDDDN